MTNTEHKDKKQTEMAPQPVYGDYPPYPSDDDEIDLIQLWQVLVEKKWFICTVTMFVTVAAVIYALLATPIYKAEVLLSPINAAQSNNKMVDIASQFGGLASMAGVNLSQGNSSTDEAIAILQSNFFIAKFIRNKNLRPILYADQWDTKKKDWIVTTPSLIKRLKTYMLPEDKDKDKDTDKGPSLWEANEYFHSLLVVSVDPKSYMVTLTIEWEDPELAAEWANDLVFELNEFLMHQTIEIAEKSIAYLENQLLKTHTVELQEILYRLVESETTTIMMANVKDMFVFKTIDPAVPPERPYKPKRKLIVVLGFTTGLMLAVFASFILNITKNAKKASVK